MNTRTHYQVLEIAQDANETEVKKAYRKKALQFHPDKNKNPGAEEEFKAINEANQVLSDETKRRAYDRRLKEQSGYRSRSKATPPRKTETPQPTQTEAPKPAHAQTRQTTQKTTTYSTKPSTPAASNNTYQYQNRSTRSNINKPRSSNHTFYSSSKPDNYTRVQTPKEPVYQERNERPVDAQLFVLMMLLNLEMMRQIQLQIAMQLAIRDMLAQQLNGIYQAQHVAQNKACHTEVQRDDVQFTYATPGMRA